MKVDIKRRKDLPADRDYIFNPTRHLKLSMVPLAVDVI
jgi:hypothetical protein